MLTPALWVFQQVNPEFTEICANEGVANAMMDALRALEIWAHDRGIPMQAASINSIDWTVGGKLIVRFKRDESSAAYYVPYTVRLNDGFKTNKDIMYYRAISKPENSLAMRDFCRMIVRWADRNDLPIEAVQAVTPALWSAAGELIVSFRCDPEFDKGGAGWDWQLEATRERWEYEDWKNSSALQFSFA